MSARKPFLVVSDIHLGAVPRETEQSFRAFLRFAATEASGLLINGDLFDVWLATRRFVVRRHVRVLAGIADVVDAGVPVYFVGGNHDALEFGGEMLRDDLGVTLLHEPARLMAGRFRTLVVHGDGIAPTQPEYRKRHPILRSGAFRWMVQRLVHVDSIHDWVEGRSATPDVVARQARGESSGPMPLAPVIEEWAMAALRKSPDIDIVLAGHCHSPAHIEVAPGRHYMNTGDWISHMTYGVLPADEAAPEVRHWPDHVCYITKREAPETAVV